MEEKKLVKPGQASAQESPWPVGDRLLRLLWEFSWFVFCEWTPKPLNPWRLFWLRLFGAKIHGTPFVHQRARIAIPGNLTLHDRACLGDRANAYTLGEIEIGPRATVAQEVYLSTGTHDFARAGAAARDRKDHHRRGRLHRCARFCHAGSDHRRSKRHRRLLSRDEGCPGGCRRGGKSVPGASLSGLNEMSPEGKVIATRL